jgi:hypothetical protein
MATYVNDLRLKEIGTGESSGTWGTETNVNLELIGEALSFGTEAITTNADTHTSTVADGSTDPARSMYIKYTGTLDSACTITIAPNTLSRLHFIENGTSGSQNIIISQGSGANVTIPPGDVKVVYLDGAGSGAAVVDAFASLNVVDLKVEDDLTVTDDLIVNGDIDLEGSIDVNGTANLDVVDIDGALTQDGGAVFNEASADVDFRVESNGQANMFFVDGGDDAVVIGHNASRKTLFNTTATAALQVEGTSGNTASMSIARNSNDDNGPQLVLAKSNGTSGGAVTVVTDDALLGRISFQGADGTQTVEGARVEAFVDGTPGADDMPGRLVFSTTADGASSPTTRVTILASGQFLHGTGTTPTGVLLGNQLVSSSATGAEIIAFRADTSVAVNDLTGAFLLGNSDTDGTEDHFVGMYGKVSSTNGSQNVHFAAGRASYEGDTPELTLFSGGDLSLGTVSPASESKLHVEVATSNPNAGSPTDSSAVMINGGTTTEGNGPVLALRNISGSKETIARLTAETTSGNNGDLTISVYAGGSTVDEKIRVQSGGGISFNGDTATANALDDYEEGSWTPALNNAGSPSYSVQYGRYTKVGRIVYCSVALRATSVSGTSNIELTGLPFTPADASDSGQRSTFAPRSGGHCSGLSEASGRFRILTNTSMAGVKGDTGTTFMQAGEFSSGGSPQFTGDFWYYST